MSPRLFSVFMDGLVKEVKGRGGDQGGTSMVHGSERK